MPTFASRSSLVRTKRCLLALWIAWLGSAPLFACDSDARHTQSGGVSVLSKVEVAIDPLVGGTVQLAHGPKLSIPAGALSGIGAVTIAIAEVELEETPGGVVSPIWEFRPAGTHFDSDVLVELPFGLDGGNPNEYSVAWTKAGNIDVFEDRATRYVGDTALTEVDHFSLGCIRKVNAARTVCDLTSEVPVDSNRDGWVDGCDCKPGYSLQDEQHCEPEQNAAGAGARPAAADGGAGSRSTQSGGAAGVELGSLQIPGAGTSAAPVDAGVANPPVVDAGVVVPPGNVLVDSGVGAAGVVAANGGSPAAAGSAGVSGAAGATPATGANNGLVQITSFSLETTQAAPALRYPGVIDQTASTITVTVPMGTDVTALKTLIGSNGRRIMPTGIMSFAAPVVFTVTGQGTGTRNYTVTVVVQAS
jgi:hypothetical protein